MYDPVNYTTGERLDILLKNKIDIIATDIYRGCERFFLTRQLVQAYIYTAAGGADKKLDSLRAPKGAKPACIHKTKLVSL